MIFAINALASDILWETCRAIGMLALIILAIFIGAKLRKLVDNKKAAKEENLIEEAVSKEELEENN